MFGGFLTSWSFRTQLRLDVNFFLFKDHPENLSTDDYKKLINYSKKSSSNIKESFKWFYLFEQINYDFFTDTITNVFSNNTHYIHPLFVTNYLYKILTETPLLLGTNISRNYPLLQIMITSYIEQLVNIEKIKKEDRAIYNHKLHMTWEFIQLIWQVQYLYQYHSTNGFYLTSLFDSLSLCSTNYINGENNERVTTIKKRINGETRVFYVSYTFPIKINGISKISSISEIPPRDIREAFEKVILKESSDLHSRTRLSSDDNSNITSKRPFFAENSFSDDGTYSDANEQIPKPTNETGAQPLNNNNNADCSPSEVGSPIESDTEENEDPYNGDSDEDKDTNVTDPLLQTSHYDFSKLKIKI